MGGPWKLLQGQAGADHMGLERQYREFQFEVKYNGKLMEDARKSVSWCEIGFQVSHAI